MPKTPDNMTPHQLQALNDLKTAHQQETTLTHTIKTQKQATNNAIRRAHATGIPIKTIAQTLHTSPSTILNRKNKQ